MTEPIDQFQKLEEKLGKVVEIFRRTQAENRSLLQQVEKLRTESTQRQGALEQEVQALRREREDVRTRIEKLLDQVETLTKQDSAG
ncbi:MAG TPA: cell division protein ZapB [Terriglobia bacterium]|nr:cell division protein ZapB [Terriglobia bacterium]